MRKKILIALSGLMMLSGCSDVAPAYPHYPPVHFTQAPFSLDVANIQIVQNYTPPLIAPNVEHLSPITPSSMVRTWASDRFKAYGKTRQLKVVIKDASITETPLPRTEGVEGMFTKDESALYSARLKVKLEIYDNDPLFPAAEITANVSRSQSVSEDISVNERQQVLYMMSKGMIEDLNKQLEHNIRQYFNKYMQ